MIDLALPILLLSSDRGHLHDAYQGSSWHELTALPTPQWNSGAGALQQHPTRLFVKPLNSKAIQLSPTRSSNSYLALLPSDLIKKAKKS
jgi:hypothetical protein